MSLFLRRTRPANLLFNDFLRTFDTLLSEVDDPASGTHRVLEGTWPRVNVYDDGEVFTVKAALPGVESDAVSLSVKDGGLTITAEREIKAPEGYSVHRQERRSTRFSRTVNFGVKLDSESVEAVIKDGLLTVTLPRLAAEKPRQIEVKVA